MTHAADLRFERIDLGDGVRLSVLPTRKLKTVLVKVYLTGDLDEAATSRALVPMVLRRGTRSLPDMQSIQRRLEDLYGASLVGDIVKVGEWHALTFRLEAVNGAFLPGHEDVFADSVRFLKELILDPALDAGAFRADYVEQEKENLRRAIESLVDDKAHYALERLIRHMAAGEPFRRYAYGDTADLPGIDGPRLTDEWRRCVRRLPMDVALAGDVDPRAARRLFEEVLSDPRDGDAIPSAAPAPRPVGEPRAVEERMDVNQGRLCLGFRTTDSYREGDLAAAVVMNGVLGGFSHSKLFQNVREKASLAYDVHSFYDKTMGLVFVACGIAVENYERALGICLEQVEALRDGDVGEPELVATRESLDNQLAMLEDNFSSLIEIDYVWGLNGREFDVAAYRRDIREVTAARVVEASRRLRLDTTYFLRD